jgi:hypothetical protein
VVGDGVGGGLEESVEEEQSARFWLLMESAAKPLLLGGRAIFYRRRSAELNLMSAISVGRFSEASAGDKARELVRQGSLERAFDLIEATVEPDQDNEFWTSMEAAAEGFGLVKRAARYPPRPSFEDERPTYVALITDVLGLGVSEGMHALLDYCEKQRPHPVWEEIAALDYRGGVDSLRASLLEQVPISDDVEVMWFAMWDVSSGLDLRGSSSWSRDPDDWEWWYHDDFDGGPCRPSVLRAMIDLARQADDPVPVSDEMRIYPLTDTLLTLGFVSLAAIEILNAFGTPAELGRQNELWAVSGHPDAVYGIILGRLTNTGFQAYTRSS